MIALLACAQETWPQVADDALGVLAILAVLGLIAWFATRL